MTSITDKDLCRFWSKVDKRDTNECWEWKASFTTKGYGAFWFNRRQELASRFSWVIHNGRSRLKLVIMGLVSVITVITRSA